ncbi:FHA domain-containing protein Far10 [Schizosaccharomyces japonicus yFS275]|uniref:FHA domain-containing protein Far10 n=1 Tax=Schizosaccharomyces japonicus (strain yFS275 / FY16936) TaxID=402676 RepID=B6K6V5_SCHJY|nr:FHA domain-containing protein Far10 [Schizosaccharomyces japonicus yFS275]EEB09259.1 FHA domain-containing protein Far10 [Schizosaccharomyces japonicus yFS275]
MSALFIFTPLNGTFSPKKVQLEPSQSVKVGRRTNEYSTPQTNNLFFDSKVLSRHHAKIWFDKNTMGVYVRDVKSSNGTFLNGTRLSAENRSSAPYRLNSGDILDFGVDICNDDSIVHKNVSGKVQIIIRDPTKTSDSTRLLSESLKVDTLLVQLARHYEQFVCLNEEFEGLDKSMKGLLERIDSPLVEPAQKQIADDSNKIINEEESKRNDQKDSVFSVHSKKTPIECVAEVLECPIGKQDFEQQDTDCNALIIAQKTHTETVERVNTAEDVDANKLEYWKSRAFSAESKLHNFQTHATANRYLWYASPALLAAVGVFLCMKAR